MVAFLLATEMVGVEYRNWANGMTQCGYGVGIALQALFAYLVREWKYFNLLITLPNLFFILYWWSVNFTIITQLYFYITIFLYHYISISLFFCITKALFFYITIFLYHYFSISLYFYMIIFVSLKRYWYQFERAWEVMRT